MQPPTTIEGLAYADQGDFQQAIADHTKALELDPQDADVYYNRAWAYYNQGDYKPAISDYTKVLELEPQSCRCLRQPGRYLCRSRRLPAGHRRLY